MLSSTLQTMNANQLPRYAVIVCSKSIRNTLGLVRHFFLQIPHLDLEIHCGDYKYGTHHNLGFTKHYEQLWSVDLCRKCMDRVYDESIQLFNFWYYPIVNCETLARGLITGIPVSFQTLIIAGFFISALSIFNSYKWISIVVIFFIILLLVNNLYKGTYNQECKHFVK